MSADTFDKSSVLKLDTVLLEQAAYIKTLESKIAIRVGNGPNDPLNTKNAGDFYLDIADENINGLEGVIVSGNHPDASTSDGIVELANVPVPFTYKTVDAPFSIVSNSVNDTALGTGATKLEVTIIDSSFNQTKEIISLNGTTPVNTIGQGIYVNLVEVNTAGSLEVNEGQIDISHTGDIIASIRSSIGRSLNSIFYVPAGKDAFVYNVDITLVKRKGASGIKEGNAFLQIKEAGKGYFSSTLIGQRSDAGNSPRPLNLYKKVPTGSIIRVMIEPLSNGMSFSSVLQILLKDVV